MTTQKRSALGRGLGALIPGASAARGAEAQPAAAPPPSATNPVELPIDRIRPNPEQPRRRFDPAELERLADSIRRHGVLQPVVVRAVENGSYELVVGERRWRASQVAGRQTLPAVVADVAPRDRLEIALVENVQRHDLNPIELALAFKTLAESGATQEQIGARVGFERSTIANHLRLLDLPREMQGDVEDGALSVGHAKAILGVASPERRRALRDRVVSDALSVRQTEEAARDLGAPTRVREKSRGAVQVVDPDLANLVDILRARVQTQVRLRGNASRGRIEIDYVGADELTRLVDLILGEP
jgi:ParB family chromosome partitioning protein